MLAVRSKASCRPRSGTSRVVVASHAAVASGRGRRLDHGKRRGAYRSSGGGRAHRSRQRAAAFGRRRNRAVSIDRRRVSVQWFSGTILTGLCGAALMGGAVFASLDGETNFATVPERVRDRAARRDRRDRADQLAPQERPAAAGRRVQQPAPGHPRSPQTSRVGDREVVRVRPFVRVAANLSLSTSELSANIPPFNAQKLLAPKPAPPASPADDSPGAEPDAEVSFVTRDLAGVLPRAKIAAVLPIDDIIARVRDTANWTGSTPIAAGRPRTAARHARSPMPPRATPIPTPASRPASCPKTSRCCPRPTARPPAATPGTSAPSRVKKGDTSPPSCASSAPRPTRSRRSPRRSARAAATAA